MDTRVWAARGVWLLLAEQRAWCALLKCSGESRPGQTPANCLPGCPEESEDINAFPVKNHLKQKRQPGWQAVPPKLCRTFPTVAKLGAREGCFVGRGTAGVSQRVEQRPSLRFPATVLGCCGRAGCGGLSWSSSSAGLFAVERGELTGRHPDPSRGSPHLPSGADKAATFAFLPSSALVINGPLRCVF